MRNQRFTQNVVYIHPGIQRAVWILENNLHFLTQLSHFLTVLFQNIFTIEVHFPACRFMQTKNCTSKCGFSTAGFSNKTKRLPFIQLEGYTINSLYIFFIFIQLTFSKREIFFQVFDFENYFLVFQFLFLPFHIIKQEAANVMSGSDLHVMRLGLPAFWHRLRTTVCEIAALWQIDRVWYIPFNRTQTFASAVQGRHTAH